MTQYKAILIDPFTKTVTEVALPKGDEWAAMKGVIEPSDGLLERIQLADQGKRGTVSVYLDECGLLVPWDKQAFTLVDGYPYPLAGKLLLVRETAAEVQTEDGPDVEEGYADIGFPVSFIQLAVQWVDAKDVRVPAPSFSACDENMQPVGERKPLYGGAMEWTYDNQPS